MQIFSDVLDFKTVFMLILLLFFFITQFGPGLTQAHQDSAHTRPMIRKPTTCSNWAQAPPGPAKGKPLSTRPSFKPFDFTRPGHGLGWACTRTDHYLSRQTGIPQRTHFVETTLQYEKLKTLINETNVLSSRVVFNVCAVLLNLGSSR